MKRMMMVVAVCAMATCCVLAACAGSPKVEPAPSGGSGGESTPAAQVAWSFDMEGCTTCHNGQDGVLPAEHAGQACISCHTDEAKLAKVHSGDYAGKAVPTRLKKTAVADDACTACHETYEALVPKTTGVTVLTDEEGTVVNPHTVKHDNADHEASDNISCAACHGQHSGTSVAESAPRVCIGCHHENVYQCHTCHD